MRGELLLAGGLAGVAWYQGWLSPVIDGPDAAGTGPGTATGRLNYLDLQFRARLELLAAAMLASGWSRPRALETYRDPTRQAYYLSKGYSQTSQSFHNVSPAFAADLYPDGLSDGDTAGRAAWYLALRDMAPTYGLRTGGSYAATSAPWSGYGLGWDPGHVEPASAGSISPAQVAAGTSPWV
jgi:hypothetical protein